MRGFFYEPLTCIRPNKAPIPRLLAAFPGFAASPDITGWFSAMERTHARNPVPHAAV